MHYDRSRKDIFLEDLLPTFRIGARFTTDEVFNWFQRDYSLFPKTSIAWLLKYLSNERPKILNRYPLVLERLGSTAWKRIA
jgi:hypothetical protein